MELVGEEKKILALFSELRFADEQATPRFAAVWNQAQSKAIRPPRAFNLSFVAAIAVLICAVLIAWWSRHEQRRQQSAAVAIIVPVNPAQIAKSPAINKFSEARPRHKSRSKFLAMKLAAHRHAELLAAGRKATRDAIAISKWQSPTAGLMRSSSDELLTTLPQLDQSANELKSFLPSRLN